MVELCCEYLSLQCIWLYVITISHMSFQVNPHFLVAWVSRNSRNSNTQPFSQSDQMIALCCECLSVQCIRLHVITMLCTCFRVNLHAIIACMSRNSLLQTGAISVWVAVFSISTQLNRRHSLNSLLMTQFNHLASLADWSSVCLRTKSCGFESYCCHLNRHCACFKQGVPWDSDNYRV